MTAPAAPTPVGIAALLAAKAATPTATSTAKTVGALGKDDFLKMLVAQLKNQDPMNPMEGTEFATQLAQFSNVEQLINISSKLDAQTASAAQGQLTAQTSLGASLIGRDILIEGNNITAVDGMSTDVDLSLNKPAATLTVTVLDSKGKAVMAQDFTGVPSGQQKLSVDTRGLEPGEYTYQVTAEAADGSKVTMSPYATARVDGVSFKDGAIMLRVGNRVIPLLNVIEIKAVTPTPIPVTTPKEPTTP